MSGGLRSDVIRYGENLGYSQKKIDADLTKAYGGRVMKNPSIKGVTRYVIVKGNRKVGAISYRLKSAAEKAARKVGGTVKAVISGATKRNGFWRERLADKVQGKKVKPLRQVAREKIAEKIRGKKNAEHRDAQHPIHVRQYWQGRKGYKSQWQRAHETGQQQLFAVKNPKDLSNSTLSNFGL